jgi:hypothetical protein
MMRTLVSSVLVVVFVFVFVAFLVVVPSLAVVPSLVVDDEDASRAFPRAPTIARVRLSRDDDDDDNHSIHSFIHSFIRSTPSEFYAFSKQTPRVHTRSTFSEIHYAP